MTLTPNERHNIALVWNGMSAILETKNEAAVEAIFAQDFIQHNPWAGDGIEHIKDMLAFEFEYKPIRWIAEDDFMAYHGFYTAPNPLGDYPLLCVDMWRIEDGKIQEHWDALSPLPPEQIAPATAGGGNGERAMDQQARQKNKNTVRRYLDHVLNRGWIDQLAAYVDHSYRYHHEIDGPHQGLETLRKHLTAQAGGRQMHDNKKIIASGDLVLAHSHYFGENERVVFDWFRMTDQHKIAEHWRVEQPISPRSEIANPHPHF